MTFNKKQSSDLEEVETNSDFEQMLQESFEKKEKRLTVGEKIKAEVLSVGKENIIVSTGTRFDGMVPTNVLTDETGKCKVKSGDVIDLYVTQIRSGIVHLTPGGGTQSLADDISQAFEQSRPVQGKVEAVNKGGFDVLIHGKIAFCPISQMDTKRIEKPEEYVGKRFEFKVTKYEESGRNVVVSRRTFLEENQGVVLEGFKNQRSVGDKLNGTVTRIESFGAFIEIAPGIEGLAHVSELSWKRVSSPSDLLKVGDAVSATIIRIDNEGSRLKISLSLKDASNDPWLNLPSEIQTGRVVSGKVTRLMDFGAFVELKPGLEGLIPLSAMSSTKRINKADEVVKVGEEVAVMIKDLNPQSKRISLSIKDALNEAASASESEDIKQYAAKVAAQEASNSMGALGAKIQAALEKKKK
ncbi:MAG: S1 RNA-binding domain-containing protein [Bdellovibrionota bacterium]